MQATNKRILCEAMLGTAILVATTASVLFVAYRAIDAIETANGNARASGQQSKPPAIESCSGTAESETDEPRPATPSDDPTTYTSVGYQSPRVVESVRRAHPGIGVSTSSPVAQTSDRIEPGKLVRLESNALEGQKALWRIIYPFDFDSSNYEIVGDRLFFATPTDAEQVIAELALLEIVDGQIAIPTQTRVTVPIGSGGSGGTDPPRDDNPPPISGDIGEAARGFEELAQRATSTLSDRTVAANLARAFMAVESQIESAGSLDAAGDLLGETFESVMAARPAGPNLKDWTSVFRIPFNSLMQGYIDDGVIRNASDFAAMVAGTVKGLQATSSSSRQAATPERSTYVQRSNENRPWPGGTESSLRAHLKTDFVNHGYDPAYVDSLSFAELRALHNDDHAGIMSPSGSRVVSSSAPVVQRQAVTTTYCPNGVCPTGPSNYRPRIRLFGRFR